MSAGGIMGVAINFFVIGGLCMVLSKAVDYCFNFLMANTTSMDAVNTMYWIYLIFIATPFLYLLLEVINHIVVANSEINQEV